MIDILFDLRGEGVSALKFDFVSQSPDKVDTNTIAINILIKIQNMDFDREEVVIEGGAVADVGHPLIDLSTMFDGYRIDSLFGAQLIL